MMANLDKSDVTTLLSLVALEMHTCSQIDHEAVSYRQRLSDIQAKLLASLQNSNASDADDGALPEFREYARRKYPTELDDDVITMIEDVIRMRRQGIR